MEDMRREVMKTGVLRKRAIWTGHLDVDVVKEAMKRALARHELVTLIVVMDIVQPSRRSEVKTSSDFVGPCARFILHQAGLESCARSGED